MGKYTEPTNYYGFSSVFASDKNYEIQSTEHWEVILSKDQFPSALKNLPSQIQLLATSVKIPSLSVSTTPLRRGNKAIKVATDASVDGGDFVIKDAIGIDLEKMLYDWWCEVYNQDVGDWGYAAEYKKTVILRQYSPDGKTHRDWECRGCFPTSFDPGTLDYDNPGKKSISMGISVDEAVRK